MESKPPTGDEVQKTSFPERVSSSRGCTPTYFSEDKPLGFFNRLQTVSPLDIGNPLASMERETFFKKPKRLSLPSETLFCTSRSGLPKKGTSVSYQSELLQTGTRKRLQQEKLSALSSLGSNFVFPPLSALPCPWRGDPRHSPTQLIGICQPLAQADSENTILRNQLGSLAQAIVGAANDKGMQSQINSGQEPKEKRKKENLLVNNESADNDREDNYWERRRRNNASAKKSRDARRARELQTQIKAAFLEGENLRMRAELVAIQEENIRLKRVLCAKM